MNISNNNLAFRAIKCEITRLDNTKETFESPYGDQNMELIKNPDNTFKYSVYVEKLGPTNTGNIKDIKILSVDNQSTLLYSDKSKGEVPLNVASVSSGGVLKVFDAADQIKDFSLKRIQQYLRYLFQTGNLNPSANVELIGKDGTVQVIHSNVNINKIEIGGTANITEGSKVKVEENSGDIKISSINVGTGAQLSIQNNKGNVEVEPIGIRHKGDTYVSITNNAGTVTCGTSKNHIKIHNGDKKIIKRESYRPQC